MNATLNSASQKAAIDEVLHATADVVNQIPALSEFAPVPGDLRFVPREPVAKPVTDCLQSGMPPPSAFTQSLVDAILSAIPHVEWRTTYTAEQVGADFVNRYGYFELYGPTGHYISQQSRAFIGYWGDNLHYPRHHHEAEEVYYILAGEARFDVDNELSTRCRTEALQFHTTNQTHSMTTDDHAVLCLALWRGQGFGESARLK